MNSATVVGYTHSGGYCLCPKHAHYGNMLDKGKINFNLANGKGNPFEDALIAPIFAGDEWDVQPTCDVHGCDYEIEVVLIGQDETEDC